jgi:hypothetical protein
MLNGVKEKAKRFENGQANNASKMQVVDNGADSGLATNNLRRVNWQFAAFNEKIEDEAAKQRRLKEEQDSLALAKKLEMEDADYALALQFEETNHSGFDFK